MLGGAGSRPANVDALAARTLVKGEPLAPPSGRADDFVWPRRDVGIPAPDSILAAPAPNQAPAATPAVATAPAGNAPAATPSRPRATSQQPNAAAQPSQPGQQQPRPPRRPAANDGAPRPPAPVGPSAQAPARNWFGWRWIAAVIAGQAVQQERRRYLADVPQSTFFRRKMDARIKSGHDAVV